MKNYLLVILIAVLFTGCKKDNTSRTELPSLSTVNVTLLNKTTAAGGGIISSEGGAPVTARGVCWSTTAAPTITDPHTADGTGTGAFTSTLSDLNAGSLYYIRAYATNAGGTSYGNEVTLTTPPIDIYIAGNITNATNTIATGVWWKNGLVTLLTTASQRSHASSIFVSGNDVYIAGLIENSFGNSVATVWKNGIPTSLSAANHYAYANAVFVSGNDVYVTGVDRDLVGSASAVLWKNGVATILATDPMNSAGTVGNAIFVNGSDVYVGGSIYTNFRSTAVVWKNSVPTTYPTGSSAAVLSVTVKDGDVYAAGVESGTATNIAKLWKNGVASDLGPGQLNAVYTYKNDVYVAGSRYVAPAWRATVWKNNIATSLPALASTSGAQAIAVYGSTTYVAGADNYAIDSVYTAKLWKNNVAIPLSDGTKATYAVSIFLKPQ